MVHRPRRFPARPAGGPRNDLASPGPGEVRPSPGEDPGLVGGGVKLEAPEDNMRRLVAVAFLVVGLGGCDEVIHGNGVTAQETRTLGSFDGAVANDGIALTLDAAAEGEAGTLVVTADENLLDLVVTQVQGGWLTVRTAKPVSSSIGITITGPAPGLLKLGANTGGAATATGVDAAGTFEVAAAGGGTVTVGGEADRLDVLASGGSVLHARGLTAREVRVVNASGGSRVEVCATSVLQATASGGSLVTYTCEPEVVEPTVSGGAVVREAG